MRFNTYETSSIIRPDTCSISDVGCNITSNFNPFCRVSATLHSIRYGNIPTGTTLNGGQKIAIFDRYLALASITAGPSGVVNISTLRLQQAVSSDQQTPPQHAPVNLVYDKKHRRYTPTTTEQNLIVRID